MRQYVTKDETSIPPFHSGVELALMSGVHYVAAEDRSKFLKTQFFRILKV